MTEQHGN